MIAILHVMSKGKERIKIQVCFITIRTMVFGIYDSCPATSLLKNSTDIYAKNLQQFSQELRDIRVGFLSNRTCNINGLIIRFFSRTEIKAFVELNIWSIIAQILGNCSINQSCHCSANQQN